MIYVDDIKQYNPIHIGHGKMQSLWCHMWTDGNIEELHEFVKKIGLKTSYFQNKPNFPHYDIIPTKRDMAIKNGAQYMPLKNWLKLHEKNYHEHSKKRGPIYAS